MARKLFNIEPGEISLVDRAANKKKFLIKKNQERKIMKTFIEKLKKYLGEDHQLTDEQIAKAESFEPKKVTELGDALDTFQSYQDELADDLLEATYPIFKALIREEQEVVELDTEGLVTLLTEKAGATFSKVNKADLERIKAIVDKMLKVKAEKIAGDNKDLSEDVLAKLEKLEQLEAEEVERLATEKADKEKKRDEAFEEMQKKIEKLEGKPRGDSKQIKGEDPPGDPKIKKEDKEFQWDSFKDSSK